MRSRPTRAGHSFGHKSKHKQQSKTSPRVCKRRRLVLRGSNAPSCTCESSAVVGAAIISHFANKLLPREKKLQQQAKKTHE